jgi:hypothetical protein
VIYDYRISTPETVAWRAAQHTECGFGQADRPIRAGLYNREQVAAKLSGFLFAVLFLTCGPLAAQYSYYVGALGGVSTLSADARSSFASGLASVSQYKPENGPMLNLFAGIDLNDYLSLQANYVWNRNQITMVSVSAPEQGIATSYEQSRTTRQHGVFGDLLVYFRNRRSWVRPYLSAGVGVDFLRSEARRLRSFSGNPVLPPAEFHAATAGFRSAVGIDVAIAGRLQFRYSFAETIQGNEISRHLAPPGKRHMAVFQNLFGFVVRFQRP